MKIRDPEVRMLAAISSALNVEYESESQEWVGSPFEWIKSRPSRQIGAIGEKLIAGWLAARGFNVARSGDSDADRVIENKRVEIKFSTLWQNGGYKFQQIRDQQYDLAICLGVSPFNAHCWVIPKTDLMRLWKVENKITSQHGGRGGSDTAWIDVSFKNPHEWLSQYGGTLSEAIGVLGQLTGFRASRIREEEMPYDV